MMVIASTRPINFATPKLNRTAIIPNAAYLGITARVTCAAFGRFEVEVQDATLATTSETVLLNDDGTWEIGRLSGVNWKTDAVGVPTGREALVLAVEMAAEWLTLGR
jgi:hypothetical protein